MRARFGGLVLVLILLSGIAGRPAFGWTTETIIRMADYSLAVAPPHLVGQIEKHQKQLHAGIRAAAARDPSIGADGTPTAVELSLIPIIETEVNRAITGIIDHKPFDQIVFQLGVISYWVAVLNDPLRAQSPGTRPPPVWPDYNRYMDAAQPRFSVLYYPYGRQASDEPELEAMLERALRRARRLAPVIAAEYRRIGGDNGLEYFDDKSTAFGVGALAFSHGVSDITGVLRYIWLTAGGADTLRLPVIDENHLILISSGSEDH